MEQFTKFSGNKLPGPNWSYLWVWGHLKDEAPEFLMQMVYLLLRAASVPAACKVACVPLYIAKTASSPHLRNYNPTRLTSVLGKSGETIVKNKINRYLTNSPPEESTCFFGWFVCVCDGGLFWVFLVRCPVSVLAIFEIQSKEACR